MKRGAGRPPKITPLVVGKLEEAFSWDCTIEEACFFAGIHRDTYYEYIKHHPELSDRVAELRLNPVLKARETVNRHLTKNYQNAMDYLARKRKHEFSPRQEVTGADGQPLFDDETRKKSKSAIAAFLRGDSR